ncbi:MAG TPA: lipid-binding SYLF domain-containing protein [Pyrinomonadaceae bacterium]|jgi:lipid-binding SYLF domain-containing protein
MNRSSQRRAACVLSVLILLCLAATVSMAQNKKNAKRMRDAARHASDAAQVFRAIMGTNDKSIPRELLDKAEAVAVFPGVVKAAFIIGGRGGQGVISRRIPGGWSAPAFFNLGGGSFGAQIGAAKVDYVLLIMNEAGVRGLMEDKFEMGGEIGVAAGPLGREASASTTATLDAGILTYSRSKGLFAGVALKGAVINPDNDLNEAVYEGKKAREVLDREHSMKEMPIGVRVYPQTLSQYSKK